MSPRSARVFVFIEVLQIVIAKIASPLIKRLVVKSSSVANVRMSSALTFEVLARCSKTRARVGRLRLKRTSSFGQGASGDDNEFLPSAVDTPVFMPVGTNGTMKGVLPEQVH